MKFKYYILVVLFSLLSGLVSPASAQSRQGALVVAAVEAYNAKDLAKAEAILKRVLALDPKNDAALYYMAMCHLVQNRAEEAEACLEVSGAWRLTPFDLLDSIWVLFKQTCRIRTGHSMNLDTFGSGYKAEDVISKDRIAASCHTVVNAFQYKALLTMVEIADLLEPTDYYRTDTHWRQERLSGVAQRLCDAMGAVLPEKWNFTAQAVTEPFYGVYHGQAALPMEPEVLYTMESDLLSDCRVYNYESGSYGEVYDRKKLEGKDLYEVFLSGSVSLLTVENPHATTDKELIIFRDSFGSAVAPLLVPGYKSVTLVDVRYVPSAMLGRFLDFHGQDVLFLYSTLVLNNSFQLK